MCNKLSFIVLDFCWKMYSFTRDDFVVYKYLKNSSKVVLKYMVLDEFNV